MSQNRFWIFTSEEAGRSSKLPKFAVLPIAKAADNTIYGEARRLSKKWLSKKMIRVLFVDDDLNILDGLRRSLRSLRAEMEAEFADCGPLALSMLEQAELKQAESKRAGFDVIVSDMRMPGMDGLTLLRHVMLRYPKVIRIVLSGYSDLETEVRSSRLAHHYFSKPCTFDQLKRALESALLPDGRGAGKEKGTAASPREVSPEIQKLVPMFLARRHADVGAIRALLQENNFEKIRVLGHNMKGSSIGYGFPELSRAGADIESAAHSQDPLQIEREASSLEAMLAVIAASAEAPREVPAANAFNRTVPDFPATDPAAPVRYE